MEGKGEGRGIGGKVLKMNFRNRSKNTEVYG